MKKNKKEEIIVVTGCSGGIGKITCEYLSVKGYNVYGISRKPPYSSELPYKIIQLDIANYAEVNTCIKKIFHDAGKIDVLINNAGYSFCGSLIDSCLVDIKQQYEINLFSPLHLINTVVPFMIKKRKGKIINIGSIGGRIPLPYQSAYSSSKAALMNNTDSLRMELNKERIKVCLIEPGDVNTNFHQRRIYSKKFRTNLIAQRTIDIMHQSEKKGTSPEKVAKVIYKAIKDENPKQRYVVGVDAILLNSFNRIMPSFLRCKIIKSLYKISSY